MAKFTKIQDCFCAFCKTPKRIYGKGGVGIRHFLMSAVFGSILMYFLWGRFDFRVIYFVLAFLSLSEIFLRLRRRLSMVCQECGFDPQMYVRDPSRAAQKVKLRLEQRKEDPTSLFRPKLDLPVLPARKKEPSAQGRLLSKKI